MDSEPVQRMTDIKRCILCGYKFNVSYHDEGYGAILDHWAREHNDKEEFWRVIDDARSWTRCAGCGEMFVSDIRASEDSLTVREYCDDCTDDNPLKGLVVEDVTGKYVMEHEAEGCC